jgi:hypothetical protein
MCVLGAYNYIHHANRNRNYGSIANSPYDTRNISTNALSPFAVCCFAQILRYVSQFIYLSLDYSKFLIRNITSGNPKNIMFHKRLELF